MEMSIKGNHLLDYLKMAKLFGRSEWSNMQEIKVCDLHSMKKSFKFLEGL